MQNPAVVSDPFVQVLESCREATSKLVLMRKARIDLVDRAPWHMKACASAPLSLAEHILTAWKYE